MYKLKTSNIRFKNKYLKMNHFVKIVLFSIFLISIKFSIFAQTEFCITGGVNYTGLSGPHKPSGYNKLFAYKGGFYILYKFSEYGSFLFELDYVQRRFKFKEDFTFTENAYITVKEKNSYLALPVQMRIERGDNTIKGFINGGLEFSVLLSRKRDTITIMNNHQVTSKNFYDHTNSGIDYGIVCGAGFQLNAVLFEFRAYMSLRNLYKETLREMRYNSLSLCMGYNFNWRRAHRYGRRSAGKTLRYRLKHLFK